MEYYFTPEASKFFPNPIEDIVGLVDERMQEGFVPWLATVLYWDLYEKYLHFDLPIFFVGENDLGKNIPIYDWSVVTNRRIIPSRKKGLAPSIVFLKDWYSNTGKLVPATAVQVSESYFNTGFYDLKDEQSVNLPGEIQVPDAGSFDYKYRDIEEVIRQISEAKEDSGRKNEDILIFMEKSVSHDWIGMYYGYESPLRCIFIRIEKILSNPFLNGSASYGSGMNHIGASSIILHEIYHAMTDENMPKVRIITPMRFKDGCDMKIADLISYVMEESMANLFAFRSIRNRFLQKNDLKDIAQFMDSQPFPYALGKRIGEAKKTLHSSLDICLRQYLTKWYRAKAGCIPVTDYRSWCRLILQEDPFTDVNIKKQIQSLFG